MRKLKLATAFTPWSFVYRRHHMKTMLFALLLTGMALSPSFADDYVYDSPYGGKKIGKVDENGYIYDSPYGGKKIGRVKDDFVYDSPYGGKKVGRIEDNGKIYDKPYGGRAVGRYDDGKVYNNPYGGKAIGSADSNEGAGYFLLREKNPDCRKK
jgi:hypothetical protein